jgi:beta-glucosidase
VHAEIGLVLLSEPPYAEGEGDRADLNLTNEDTALIMRMRPHCERLIVILYSGRPLLIEAALSECDAWVAAWLPGSEGQGIVDVLVGDAPFTGRSPYAWPPLFPSGHGLQS